MRKILLVLLFVVTVFANDKWLPSICKAQGHVSAVLMPNAKGFYTYQDGLVTQWRLDPIQPIKSFRINTQEDRFSHRHYIFITKDTKRLIFASPSVIQLWSLKTKKLLNEVIINKAVSNAPFFAAYSDYGLILLDYKNELKLLDENSLDVTKQIHLHKDYPWEQVSSRDYYPQNILAGKNILQVNYFNESYYIDIGSLTILDLSKTDIEDRKILQQQLRNNKLLKQEIKGNDTRHIKMLQNRKKYFEKYKNDFNKIIWENFMKVIWKYPSNFTLSSCELNATSSLALYKVYRTNLYRLHFTQKLSNNDIKTIHYTIWQHNKSWYVEDENHFFNASDNIRKYLHLKNDEYCKHPIDKKTYQRYKKNYKKLLMIRGIE